MAMNSNIPYQDITYCMIGAAMRVHNKMGPGYRERHYQRAMTAGMRAVGLTAIEEYPFDLYLDDNWIGRIYLDHLVDDVVVVELKAVTHLLTDDERAQVITYLAATDRKVGLLFNFGRRRLEYERILQPRITADWPDHIRRYAWTPPG